MRALVLIPNYGEGPRIDRLRKIWRTVGRTELCDVILTPPEASHADSFNAALSYIDKERYDAVLFTELDFLPFHLLFELDHQAVACAGATRDPLTKRLRHKVELLGGWYYFFRADSIPDDLDFTGEVDAGDIVHRRLDRVFIYPGEDCYPRHYGIKYPVGTHLFWSRHLHDDPNSLVSGFRMGDVQEGHDRAVDEWTQSPLNPLGSCSEFTARPATSTESFPPSTT